jgi:pyruvate kinase
MKMRKTKIVCTLGPATDSLEILEELIKNGMNVGRLNFSHGTHEEHLERVKQVRSLNSKLSRHVALLLDTRGPEIRIKRFENDRIELKAGNTFTLTTEEIMGNNERVSVTHTGLPGNIEQGDTVLIDDGLIELSVDNITKTDVVCRVITGGEVSNNKGVNLPGITINLPYISERDKEDILIGISHEFDFIAASFARSSEDIKQLKSFLDENGGSGIKIIAKIENRDGVNNFEEILRISDGIMVARGDMGVEIPFEELPGIQKEIIRKCYLAGKPVITATQMLDSMIRNPRPTRAEITDVANAVYDGTSAIMLSGETSIGKYPVKAVQVMSKIAVEAESDIDYITRFTNTHVSMPKNVTNAISKATCETAHTLGASAIVTVTKSGHTAKMVSKYRPACPIIATTVDERVCRQLSLSWGVFPILTRVLSTTDEIFNQAIEQSQASGMIRNGDLVVITGGMMADVSGTTNTLRVQIVGDLLAEGMGINQYSASGVLCVIQSERDDNLKFNAGDILVFNKASDDILEIMKNASAIITEEKARDSKAVVAARSLNIPVVVDVKDATRILKSGTIVTVNAEEGKIFSGVREARTE